MATTLEELFERYRRRGDLAALGAVFDRTAPALLGIAAHLCGNRHDAEDAVQATWLRAIETAGTWDAQRPLAPWLVGILAHRARQRRAAAARRPDPARVAVPSAPAEPSAAAGANELGDAVAASIEGLPEPYQPVLRLHLLDGRDPHEIATALRRRPGTVRSQLARGLRGLRRLLPAGFAAAAGAQSTPALGAMRAAVLASAGATAPATATATTLAIGGMLMKKLTVVAALAAVILVWLAWPRDTAAPASPASSAAVSDHAAVQQAAADAAAGATLPAAGGEQRIALEPPPTAAASSGNLRVRVVWRHGQRPAAGVAVFVEPGGATARRFAPRRADTGADGVAHFAELPAGRYTVDCHRWEYGNRVQVAIAAGAEASCEFALDGLLTVTGLVVDGAGRPIAGARIVVGASDPRELATADDQGRFELGSLGAEVRLGARAAGFAPSPLFAVPPAAGGRVGELRIVLEPDGGCLVCTVADAGGRPLADAAVSVGPGHFQQRKGDVPWIVSTDRQGRAVFDGVAAGEVEVFAWAPGQAPWRGSAALRGGATAELPIALLPGASLRGQVRDRDGRALPGATVAVGRTGSAAQQQFGPFAFQYAVTDAEGSYRLDGLTPGSIDATASLVRDEVSGTVTAAAGEVATWNPELPVREMLSGIVLGPDGAGVPDAIVEAHSRGRSGWNDFEVADARGRFQLRGFDRAQPLHVEVRMDYLPVARFDLPVPEQGELVLRLATDPRAGGRIAGAVVDAGGQPLPLAEITVLMRDYGSSPQFRAGDGGRFDFGPLPAAEYDLLIRADGHARHRTGWRRVAAGATTDFGSIALQPGGSVEVRLRGEVQPAKSVYLAVLDAAGEGKGHVEVRDGRGSLGHLAAGRYELLVRYAPHALARHAFEMPSGGSVQLDLQLEPGAPFTLTLRGASVPPSVTVELRTADGRLLLQQPAAKVMSDRRVYLGATALRPGSYQVAVLADGARIGEQTFAVASADTSCRVDVDVRWP